LEKLVLRNDRKKLLAAISYFLKFAIKLASTKKINISFQKDKNQLNVIVNDMAEEASKKLISEMKEVYRVDNNLEKNNFGISPIAIKLARILNEITLGKVSEYSIDNKNSILLSFPISIESFDIIVEEKVSEVEIVPIDKKETVTEESKLEELEITETKIDEKIIEDITEEKEIDTEEIATIEKTRTDENTITKSEIDGVELSKLSCLLIEDSIDSQLLFKTQMKDFKLLKVASGLTEALPLIKKYHFDLIYVDINLQGQYNGLDALKIIRQFEKYKSIPIIAITSYPFEGDKENFLLAGFNDYFIKPLLREQLLSSIDLLV
jgi:CheY-like chemotaxis protein